MQYGTINDITQLKFFIDNGSQIPMQRKYSLTWELIPGDFASQYIEEDFSGYFIADIDPTDPSNITILEDTFLTEFLNNGKAYIRFSTTKGTDANGMTVFSYYEDVAPYEYYNYIRKIFMHSDNKVRISINVKNDSYTYETNVGDIFALNAAISEYDQYYKVSTIYTGNNTTDSNEYYQTIGLQKIDLAMKVGSSTRTFIHDLLETAVPNIGIFFPFITYQGLYHLERISEGFIAADTITILEENEDASGNVTYKKPYLTTDSPYYLAFLPESNSEIKLIKKDVEYEIEYVDKIMFDLADDTNEDEPLYFTDAFQADDEGAYQNYIGMYLISKENTNIAFFMGLISVKSEVEGEDARFRTLLGNFGVPDPYYYSNIFAEQEYDEQGKDYELINRKSKQLMLSYEQIFSYIGTYKALMNAIKFLGYYDIIFKEWYTIKTTNDIYKDIAVLVFDTSSGSFLKLKLASYGISIEDFRNYNKINKLTMVYHINEQDEANEEVVQLKLVHFDENKLKFVQDSSLTYNRVTDVPLTKPIYIYRNDEILVKLIAVKKWLERHVIGVGAYIADITGEGLYFGWQKTQGYHTLHHLNDYSQEQYYTADVKCVLPFKLSHSTIACTLNELNNAVRFEDYDNTPIKSFIRYDIDLSIGSTNLKADISTLVISNSIESPVLGDEFEFDAILKSTHGTLCEWTDDSSLQIFIEDGEIKLLFENSKEGKISYDNLPYITLENANIHKTYGDWKTNIKWMVREVIDFLTGNTRYKLQNYKQSLADSYAYYNNAYIILEKDSSDAYIKYTEDTKWDVPMFIIHGYKFMNTDIDSSQADNFNLSDGEYVLEILKGDMLFKNINGCSGKLLFSNDHLANRNSSNPEQAINLEYVYHTERKPFVEIYDSSIIRETSAMFDFDSTLDPMLNTCKTNIDTYYETMTDDISSFLDIPYLGVAYEEAQSFINSSISIDTSEFLEYKKALLEKTMLNDKYVESYNNNYLFNRTIDASVSRLGDYEILARAYDKHNNMYVSKYDNTASVTAKPISIDTFSFNLNSGNDESFYRYNTEGTLLDTSSILELENRCVAKPKFPTSYKIPDFDNDPSNNTITFDNLSYALDTPKNNEYVIFENCTERVVSAEINGTYDLKLWLLDENKDEIHIDSSKNTTNINLVIYDKLLMEDIVSTPCLIYKTYIVKPENDVNYSADSYIEVRLTSLNFDAAFIAGYVNNSDRYKTYILNTTEYNLSNFNISYDYNAKETYLEDKIKNHEYPLFNSEDVVKIRYYMKYLLDSSIGNAINETAYRINKVYMLIDNNQIDMSLTNFDKIDKSTIKKYIYVLNGLLNEGLLKDSSINSVMTYANENPVHYMAKIIGDGYEYNYKVGYNGYSILQDKFAYNQSFMMLNNYIDDTYNGRIINYDYTEGKRIWSNMIDILSGNESVTDIFYYHEFPISIDKGNSVVFLDNNDEDAFLSGYHVEWKCSLMMLDDEKNLDGYLYSTNKLTLTRITCDDLTIKPDMFGSYDILLKCVDKYGNILVNPGSGYLYVRD